MAEDSRMVAVKRCSRCDIDWPSIAVYAECPGCDGETWDSISHTRTDFSDASKLAQKLKLEREGRRLAEVQMDQAKERIMAGLERAYSTDIPLPPRPQFPYTDAPKCDHGVPLAVPCFSCDEGLAADGTPLPPVEQEFDDA